MKWYRWTIWIWYPFDMVLSISDYRPGGDEAVVQWTHTFMTGLQLKKHSHTFILSALMGKHRMPWSYLQEVMESVLHSKGSSRMGAGVLVERGVGLGHEARRGEKGNYGLAQGDSICNNSDVSKLRYWRGPVWRLKEWRIGKEGPSTFLATLNRDGGGG